jgi:hypothetical protein
MANDRLLDELCQLVVFGANAGLCCENVGTLFGGYACYAEKIPFAFCPEYIAYVTENIMYMSPRYGSEYNVYNIEYNMVRRLDGMSIWLDRRLDMMVRRLDRMDIGKGYDLVRRIYILG